MVSFTGLGSLPGRDMGAALRLTFDLVGGLPYLPELPARGPWAAIVGRGLGLPDGLPAEFEAGEWRLASAPGVDQRRARATLRDDVDQLEEAAQGYRGPLKVSAAGPWTLAASTGVFFSGRVLADRGARRDLAGAVAHGVGELVADVHRRLPQAELIVQVDEPSLPAVLAGGVPTPGGLFRHDAVELPDAVSGLAAITGELARRGVPVQTVVHCCAPGLPVAAMPADAGFDAVSLDASLLRADDIDALASAYETGAALWLGVYPTADPATAVTADDVRRTTLRLLDDVGATADRIVLTPACGLAGFPAAGVPGVFRTLATVARQVSEGS